MKVIMYPAVTLDGFIADLNGECYSWISEDDEKFYEEAIKNAGCCLVGRKTYDQYIDSYPLSNGATSFVYTTSQEQPDQDKVKFVRGTAEEVLQQIAGCGFSEVILSGGGDINGIFAEAGLINEIVISIYGVTLGEGIPLFGAYKPKLKLSLISSNQDVPGVVKNHYEVIS